MKLLAKLIADNLRRFAAGAMRGGAAFLGIVGGLCWLLLRTDSGWQVGVVALLVLLGALLTAVMSGVRFAATQTLREWVDSTGVGPMLSKVIFKQALGVSDKRPQGATELAAQLQGATLIEAKRMVSERLGALFMGDSLDRWLPQQGRWLAKKLTSTAGWAVSRSLLDHFELPGSDDQPIDLLALREALAEGLHEKAIALVTARVAAIMAAVITVAAGVCLVVAALVGQF